MTTAELPKRSVSQVNQYRKCPQSYKLARIDKVWQRPAAWLPQGTAVHNVLEHIEKQRHEGVEVPLEEALRVFDLEYAKDINRYTAITPNFQWWSASGPYRGREDTERRWGIGREQVEKFYKWRSDVGQVIWVAPDGKPAIELSFEIVLDGILVRGFIDAIVVMPDGSLRVRDYKTGNTPGDDFQLGVYALAIFMLYGVLITTGDYYMAGKKGKPGKPTAPYDLTEWTEESVAAVFREIEDKIQAGEFDADPEPDKCRFCDVSYSCEFFAGD